jgi:hypothetical protein
VRKASAPKALTGRSKCTMKSAGMCQGPAKYTKPAAGAPEVWTACARGHQPLLLPGVHARIRGGTQLLRMYSCQHIREEF